MARLSLRRVRPLALLLAGAMLGASVSIVSGAIPSSVGQINACYNKTTGALRVIDYPTVRCKSATEKFLRWNVKGVPGTAGTAGGPAGPPGPVGPAAVSDYQVVRNLSIYEVKTSGIDVISDAVNCPAGQVAVGGGGSASVSSLTGSDWANVQASYPETSPARWIVHFTSHTSKFFAVGDHVTYNIYATCVNTN